MSFRSVAGLACAAAVAFAPASAHAAQHPVCVLPYGSAVPAGVRHWQCVGGSTVIQGPCSQVGVNDPRNGFPLAGVEICGLV